MLLSSVYQVTLAKTCEGLFLIIVLQLQSSFPFEGCQSKWIKTSRILLEVLCPAHYQPWCSVSFSESLFPRRENPNPINMACFDVQCLKNILKRFRKSAENCYKNYLSNLPQNARDLEMSSHRSLSDLITAHKYLDICC